MTDAELRAFQLAVYEAFGMTSEEVAAFEAPPGRPPVVISVGSSSLNEELAARLGPEVVGFK